MSAILIVEDEAELATILEDYLRLAGYRTEWARDGVTALELFRRADPDLVLLDIMLPGMDGLELLKRIRQTSQIPVLMLTARVEELDTVLSLELGADDHIAKPFRPREVVARVRAALRRTAALPLADVGLTLGRLRLEPDAYRAWVDTEALELTPAEFRLLYTLARQPGRVFSRSDLIAAALPESEALERTVDVHLARVRRKLAAHGLRAYIGSLRGVGYRFETP